MVKIRLLFLLIPIVWLTVYTGNAFPVSLEFFEGSWMSEETAELSFGTGSEVDHAGFYVWRSTANIPPNEVNTNNAIRLTNPLILGETPCGASGSDYLFLDDTVSATQDVYYYYLESLACSSGNSEFYGSIDTLNSGLPVVNPNVPPDKRLYMPLLHQEEP